MHQRGGDGNIDKGLFTGEKSHTFEQTVGKELGIEADVVKCGGAQREHDGIRGAEILVLGVTTSLAGAGDGGPVRTKGAAVDAGGINISLGSVSIFIAQVAETVADLMKGDSFIVVAIVCGAESGVAVGFVGVEGFAVTSAAVDGGMVEHNDFIKQHAGCQSGGGDTGAVAAEQAVDACATRSAADVGQVGVNIKLDVRGE